MAEGSTVRVTTFRDAGTTRLLVDGDLDGWGASVLSTYVHAELYRGVRIVVDVEGVTFIDAQGVRALVDAHVAAEHRGAELVVGNAHGDVLRTIELAGATFALDDRLQRLLAN